MKNAIKSIAVILIAVGLTALTGCGKDYGSKIERREEVNRTYEKIDPSPAVTPTFYNIKLKLDTQDDRLYEMVSIRVLNNTDEPVDTVYLRYYPMGYTGYLVEALPNSASANKDKEAKIQSIRLEGLDQELPLEYLMDNTVIKIDFSGDAIEPGESAKILVDAWTDIPDVHDRFGMVKSDKGKLYLLTFCYPYVECSSDGMWQIDPPIYLAGDGENRNPDFADYHVEIEMPEDYTVASAGTITGQGGITSIELKNISDLALAVSNFMDVETFEAQGTTVRNYYLKAGKEEAYRAVSKQTVLDAFDFYTKLLGKYARDEFTMIQGVAGMEHSGLAFVDGLSYLNDQNDDMNGLQRNIAHELGHSWFYDSVRNNEFREGWIDEGITSYLASDEMLYQDLESYKTEKEYGADGSLEVYTNARNDVRSKTEANVLKGLDHCYLNEPWNVFPEGSNAGSKEYVYTPIFLYHAKEIMGEEAFYDFLSEVYQTYTNKIAHTEDILAILRSHNDSKEMDDLIAFYFKENK